MSFRKYAGDYGLENVPGKSGKLKTVAVYKGAGYEFVSAEGTLSRARPVLAVCAVAFWAAQLLALSLNTRCARCMWMLMPQGFSLLAFGFVTVGVWMLLRAKPPMTREYAERMRDRFSGGALMAMLLNGAALIGALIAAVMFRGELMLPADIIYIIMLAAAQAACVVCFMRRSCLEIRVISKESE